MPARRAQPTEPYRQPRLRKSPEDATKLVEARIKAGQELETGLDPMRNPTLLVSGKTIDDIENDVTRWSSFNSTLLGSLFDTDEIAHDYGWSGGFGGGSTYDGPAVVLRRIRQSVADRVSHLVGIKERIEAGLYERAPDVADETRGVPAGRPASRGSVVNFYGGTIGTLNTGEVLGNIRSQVSSVTGSPSADAFRESVEAFSKVIAAVEDLPETKRTEALEGIEFIAEAGAQPSASRRAGILHAVVASLPETLALSSRALDAWDKYGGPIRAHLGL